MTTLCTNLQLAKRFNVSDQLMRYYLKKRDAPDAKLRKKTKRVVRYYDLDDCLKWWGEQ